MDELTEVKNDVTTLLGLFLEKPEELRVSAKNITDDSGTMIHVIVRVAPEDVAKCIGRLGSTAEAVRRIVRLIVLKRNIPYQIGYKVDHASSDKFKRR